MRVVNVLLVLVLAAVPASSETILAVFAHPDDETTVGAALARYADEGHSVYVATVTSGQVGNANTSIPTGDPLGRAREEELRCSCRALGIHPPFTLGLMDGDIANPRAMNEIVKRLREIVEQVKPGVMITWGPDGLTGHPDHRTVHATATEVFQQRALLKHHPRKLYYVAWPEDLLQKAPAPFPRVIRGVAREFITTAIDAVKYSPAAFRSVQCHKTQWTAERMEQHRVLLEEVLNGKVYLRLALPDAPPATSMESGLFRGFE